MKPRVSVPKIYLRGNKWYVRVQVPKSMQDRLKRKEYWVSLRTSDRTEALQHATAATQKKRREISSVYRRLSSIKETFHEPNVDQQLALGREAYAIHVSGNTDLITEFRTSDFETLQAFTEARSGTVNDMVARLRLAHSDTPHIRTMALTLMEENGIRLTDEEEKHYAIQHMGVIFEDIANGKLHDFRLVLRGSRVTHSDDERISGRAKLLEQQGFYILKYDPNGSMPGDVWTMAPERTKGRDLHYAAYPEALCERPILSTCPKGGIVLDPFLGSGTTLVTAKRHGRNGIGFDLSQDYLDLAQQRIDQIP